MSALINKTALVYDRSGYFLFLEEELSYQFSRVQYFCEWKGFSPKSKGLLVGKDLTGVERVTNFFDAVDMSDVVIFPDVGNSDLQNYLRSNGKKVWGHGSA